ncbi:unnamed protein product [Phytophthora lilii]|uniref:Unnamed protein product n=1 Tax=Phytophthora lilii TaxID=2077276 RepID=A0A9W6WFP9_9STRA|nr:unnamed protein product [Phytophthora lilii]
MTERETVREPAPERSPFDREDEPAAVTDLAGPTGQDEDEGMEEDNAIEVESDDRVSEESVPVVEGRSIAVSPMREDILDRPAAAAAAAAAAAMAPSRNLTPSAPVEISPSPYRAPSSPRYIHGRRLQASDAAIPSSRNESYAAGVTTEQADRYRMSRSSGKRFRSPAKRTSLWDDLCNSYIHQSGGSKEDNRSTSSFSHKRQVRFAAERTFGGSSVFRTLNMDTYGWPQSESSRGERQPILTGPQAMNVANRAVREFLGGRDEEAKRSEPPSQSRQGSVESNSTNLSGDEVVSTPMTGNRSESSTRKSKRVSFGGNTTHPQPRTLPVLADKTTQTEASLLPVRSPRKEKSVQADAAQFCPGCDTAPDESDRPRKAPRGSSDSSATTPTKQRNFRRTSSIFNPHLTNPILLNPRYPPEPTSFRGRSSYSSAFNDRLAWR